MNMRNYRTPLAALCSLLAVSACKRGDDAGATVDTANPPAAAPVPAQPATESGGALAASELEWQKLADSVRATVGRDSAAAAQALRSAAASVRREAGEAKAAARTALTRSADELDTLAAKVAAGARRTEQSVDSAFARLAQAEALNRLQKSLDAWAAQQRARAAEELESAAANFERAANDASVTLDAGATKARDDARAVAGRVKVAAEVTDEEFRSAAAALEKQVQGLGARIARKS